MMYGIKSLTHEVAPTVIAFDWYCQTYRCKMLKATCDLRQQLAKYNGTNQCRAQYSETCGTCSQIKKGNKMFIEKVETITVNENETTRTCRNCKELLPMDAFTKNKECVNGYEWTCRKCRAEKKKLAKAIRKSEVRREKDGMNIKVRKSPPVEPPKLPVGLPPGVTDPVSRSDGFPLTRDFICDNVSSVSVDFSCYPDLLVSISDTAKREFRTPMMQILFMLSKFNDK